ncbi:universal stress protein [Changchengzhania lutea]|uniref:universal stress protein n=1 Tax=Changchengzhania lutea TaxID=2049305 RepID=UPI00115E4279|nr:universal stress protein [Changchengzhania lutea]
MKNNKYKILVLSDLKNATNTTLKSSISLAKMVDGDIDFFHVKRPTDVVKKENQLSAIRTINKEHFTTDKEIKNLIDPIYKDYGIKINYKISYGNVKSEISRYIKEHKPDIIVLGKRKSKLLSFIGDNITHLILKEHKGVIMIAADKNPLEPNKEISLGILNDMNESFNLEFAEDLIHHSQTPIKSFNIIKNSNVSKPDYKAANDEKTKAFVFEHNDNAIENIDNYLSKNKVNLLYLNRTENKESEKLGLINSDLNEVISRLNISLIVAGEQNLTSS